MDTANFLRLYLEYLDIELFHKSSYRAYRSNLMIAYKPFFRILRKTLGGNTYFSAFLSHLSSLLSKIFNTFSPIFKYSFFVLQTCILMNFLLVYVYFSKVKFNAKYEKIGSNAFRVHYKLQIPKNPIIWLEKFTGLS